MNNINPFSFNPFLTATDQLPKEAAQAQDGQGDQTLVGGDAAGTKGTLLLNWAGFTGGMTGIAAVAGKDGNSVEMGVAADTPGANALGTVGTFSASNSFKVDNTIEVGGSGMGADKKYKMYAGELLAVYSVIKDGGNHKIEDVQAALKERYGIDTEVQTIDGKKALVNKETGNTIIRDGNGNGVLDKSDMKFKEAVDSIKDRFDVGVEDFENKYDITKGGTGEQTGNLNNFRESGLFGEGGFLDVLKSINATKTDKTDKAGDTTPEDANIGDEVNNVSYDGHTEQTGLRRYGDKLWDNTVLQIFSKATDYATAFA